MPLSSLVSEVLGRVTPSKRENLGKSLPTPTSGPPPMPNRPAPRRRRPPEGRGLQEPLGEQRLAAAEIGAQLVLERRLDLVEQAAGGQESSGFSASQARWRVRDSRRSDRSGPPSAKARSAAARSPA